MSAQIRYRTLVRNIGRIYAAPKETRMDLLQTGLDEIVAIVGPNGSESWNTVGTDSERLLKVWVAKESDDPAAIEVAQQLTDILWELSADKIASEPASPPRLVIKEPPVAPMNTPVPADTIRHVQPFSLSTPVAVEIKEVTVVEEASVIESDEESSVNQIDEAEVEEEEEAASVAASEEDEEAASVAASEEDEEVLEPPVEEEEEEEEEGMSVEQITIRGRTYWRDTDTDDLYAVVGEDDVGDKVGQIVNGVARFLPLKK